MIKINVDYQTFASNWQIDNEAIHTITLTLIVGYLYRSQDDRKITIIDHHGATYEQNTENICNLLRTVVTIDAKTQPACYMIANVLFINFIENEPLYVTRSKV